MPEETGATPSNGNGNKRLMPSNATTVGTVGGAGVGPVIIWLLSLAHVEVPAEVAASLGAVIGNFLGYFFEGGRKS